MDLKGNQQERKGLIPKSSNSGIATRRGFNPDLSQNQGTTTVKTSEKNHALATHHFPSIHAKKGTTAVKQRSKKGLRLHLLQPTEQRGTGEAQTVVEINMHNLRILREIEMLCTHKRFRCMQNKLTTIYGLHFTYRFSLYAKIQWFISIIPTKSCRATGRVGSTPSANIRLPGPRLAIFGVWVNRVTPKKHIVGSW